MPRRVEDPVHLSIARLKSDLVAHNVALPPSKSRKEVYVALHLKHVPQKTYADFSSDDEEQTQRAKVSLRTFCGQMCCTLNSGLHCAGGRKTSKRDKRSVIEDLCSTQLFRKVNLCLHRLRK